MTNAEKFEEIFGFPPDKGNCPAESCVVCPMAASGCINHYEWWGEEYKGAPTIPIYEHERLKSEWIDYSNEGYVECPYCGSATNCEDNKDELHFCWNCGAELTERHECETCRYCNLKITEEPCYSCVYSGETDNINLTDRWEPK